MLSDYCCVQSFYESFLPHHFAHAASNTRHTYLIEKNPIGYTLQNLVAASGLDSHGHVRCRTHVLRR